MADVDGIDLAEIGRAILALDPEDKAAYMAAIADTDEADLIEGAIAAAELEGADWRTQPALMAHHLTRGQYRLWAYTRLLGEKFADAVEGRSIRQIWLLPRRYGKSVMASQWGPTWALDSYPHLKLLLASYGDQLAVENAVGVRDKLLLYQRELRTRLRPDRRQAGRFVTTEGGGILARGISSSIVGFGADGAVFDDPYKNWQEAHSPARRELVMNAFRSVVYGTLETETAFVIIPMCLTADSQIPVVGRGWVPVATIRPGESVYSFDGERIGTRKVIDQRLAGTEPVYTVRTARHRLSATDRHPLLVVPDNGHARPRFEPIWRRADEVRPGDLLVTAAELPTGARPPVQGWDEAERAWLLGYMTGDGWVTTWGRTNYDKARDRAYRTRSWMVGAAIGAHEPINERVGAALTEAFGRAPRRLAASWRLDSNEAGRTLERLGLLPGVKARDKRIAGWVFDAPTETQRAYLAGLMAADGYQKKPGHAWTLASASRELCEDARRLALTCGLRPGHTRSERPQWRQPPNSPEPVWSQTHYIDIALEPDRRGQSLVEGRIPPGIRIDRVTDVTAGPVQAVYDLEVEDPANFVAEGLLVHNTCWHEADISQTLLKMMGDDDTAERWELVRLPELAETPNPKDPKWWLRLPDPLDREPGQVIEPERFSLTAVLQKHKGIGSSYFVAAMYQQRPAPEEGGEVKRGWFRAEDAMPTRYDQAASSWDMKLKDKETGDYVVGQAWGRTGKDMWLFDQMRGQWNQATTQVAIALFVVRHPNLRVHYIENSGYGPEVIAALRAPRPGYAVSEDIRSQLGITDDELDKVNRVIQRGINGIIPVVPKGSKSVRMRAVSGFIEAGDVHVPEAAPWLGIYLDEMASFPNGAHDDQVDATSQALSKLSTGKATAKAASGTIQKAPINTRGGGTMGVTSPAPGTEGGRTASVRSAARAIIPHQVPRSGR